MKSSVFILKVFVHLCFLNDTIDNFFRWPLNNDEPLKWECVAECLLLSFKYS